MIKPDTHEMVMIHRVFRREAAWLLRLVFGASSGDVVRAAQIADAIREYIRGLHHHHQLEDELIWPLLHVRAGVHDDLVTRMKQQHGRLDETLETIPALLGRWEAGAAAHVRDELAGRLAAHRAALVEHLDDEEKLILPLVAEYLTVDEWDSVGRRGLKNVPRTKAMLALGAILEDATPDEHRYFLAKVPTAGRVWWRLLGRRQYQRQMARLREPQQR